MTDIKSLYEKDYALWLDRTIADLKDRKLDSIDWENLIEEVESLAGRDRRELQSRLITLLEHLLKRKYVNLPECYRGWISTVIREQQEIENILKQSPSLQSYYYQSFEDCWAKALKRVKKEYDQFNFPSECPFPINPDRLLNDTFWE